MSDEGTVEREITVPVDPERAWELVTEPEHLEQWFAERVELDPTPGAPVRVVGDDGGERHGVVEEVDAPRRLRFVWYAPPDGPPGASFDTSRYENCVTKRGGRPLLAPRRSWPGSLQIRTSFSR